MKKAITITLVSAMIMSLTACSAPSDSTADTAVSDAQMSDSAIGEALQPASPWTEYSSLEDMQNAVDFPLNFPESANGLPVSFMQEMKTVAEARYSDGTSEIMLRKGAGTDDISGDYTEYAETSTLDVNGVSITAKGENGKIMLAVWNDGEYSYAVSADGLIPETVKEIAAALMQ